MSTFTIKSLIKFRSLLFYVSIIDFTSSLKFIKVFYLGTRRWDQPVPQVCWASQIPFYCGLVTNLTILIQPKKIDCYEIIIQKKSHLCRFIQRKKNTRTHWKAISSFYNDLSEPVYKHPKSNTAIVRPNKIFLNNLVFYFRMKITWYLASRSRIRSYLNDVTLFYISQIKKWQAVADVVWRWGWNC